MVTNPQYGVHGLRMPVFLLAAKRRRRRPGWLRTVLARMRMRHELRRDLEHLDDRSCRDAGMSLLDLRREAAKPFWRR